MRRPLMTNSNEALTFGDSVVRTIRRDCLGSFDVDFPGTSSATGNTNCDTLPC